MEDVPPISQANEPVDNQNVAPNFGEPLELEQKAPAHGHHDEPEDEEEEEEEDTRPRVFLAGDSVASPIFDHAKSIVHFNAPAADYNHEQAGQTYAELHVEIKDHILPQLYRSYAGSRWQRQAALSLTSSHCLHLYFAMTPHYLSHPQPWIMRFIVQLAYCVDEDIDTTFCFDFGSLSQVLWALQNIQPNQTL